MTATMSPRRNSGRQTASIEKSKALLAHAGALLRSERRRRRLSLASVAAMAGVSRGAVEELESGQHGSVEMIVAVAGALGQSVDIGLFDRKRREHLSMRQSDPVHAAMGELEAGQFRSHGRGVGI